MSEPTIGQLERELAQRIGALYHAQLGQRPSRVICHFFDTQLAITFENSVTLAEQSLMQAGKDNLAEKVRLDLDKIIQPQIKQIIEEIIEQPVLELIGYTSLISGRTAMIVILKQLPQVRNPGAIPKTS
jgi:uncharacterized protein YbcI